MSYICEKPAGSCRNCYHYRYDEDYGGMACFAEQDERARRPERTAGVITGIERKNREELFKLMRENPELPVVAMVDSEIVQDDGYSRWMGAWGSSSIEEYFIGEERIHFREADDFDEVEETLTDGQVCYDDFEAMSDEEAVGTYNSLPWIKAIVVNIDLPD